MLVSTVALVLLVAYLIIGRQLILSLLVLSVLPQYQFRYWQYLYNGFSNHLVVYSDVYSDSIQNVNLYLDCVLTFMCIVIYFYARQEMKKIQCGVGLGEILRPYAYLALLAALLGYAIHYRFGGPQDEVNFPTFLMASYAAAFAYAGVYSVSWQRAIVAFLLCMVSATLIGFRSLTLIFFTSILLGKLSRLKALLALGLMLIMLVAASLVRGINETGSNSGLLSLVTSHYDSWSFLVIAFDSGSAGLSENLYGWICSFFSMIPGATRLFNVMSYGHYLNFKYTNEWFSHASVLLAPGIIGELWSLNIFAPFLFLPLFIIIYDRLAKSLGNCSQPMYVAMVAGSIFFLEIPLSNSGQLIKTLIMIWVMQRVLVYKQITN